MKYLFDTDHISFLQRPSSAQFRVITARMGLCPSTDLAFSFVSLHEQFQGVHAWINRAKSHKDVVDGYGLLEEVYRSFSIVSVLLSFDAAAAAVFDSLVQARVRVSTMDLRIAAIALSRGLTVLTRDTRDFSKVPGLVTDDWTV